MHYSIDAAGSLVWRILQIGWAKKTVYEMNDNENLNNILELYSVT